MVVGRIVAARRGHFHSGDGGGGVGCRSENREHSGFFSHWFTGDTKEPKLFFFLAVSGLTALFKLDLKQLAPKF